MLLVGLATAGAAASEAVAVRRAAAELATHQQAGGTASHSHDHATDKDVTVSLVTEPAIPQAGERAELKFTIAEGSGAPADLVTLHARKLHVVIVSEDMQVLGHLHPRDFGGDIVDGRAKLYFGFPRPGRYLVAVDFMTSGAAHAAQFRIDVGGASDHPTNTSADGGVQPGLVVVAIDKDDRYTEPVELEGGGQAGGYVLSLQRPHVIRAGVPATFVYRFRRNGTPVTDLRPYLDAAMHLAVVKGDLTQFLHRHGLAGDAARSGGHGHGWDSGHHAAPPAAFGPRIAATITFPEPGTYYLFGQAAQAGSLLVSRFPVEVR